MKFYSYSGKEVEEDEEERSVGAKSDGVSYFVKEYRGMLFNPIGVDARNANRATWREATESCFALYTRFLRTKEDNILRRAERELIDV